MGKILTVSVAAYNMEKYIEQNLESMAIPEIVDDLEVFIVDDGGTDNTLAIAEEYAERYPNTFIAVHKENGGYGTTVNYSIAHATGKYFRCLDGDDWFSRENLIQFVGMLKTTDADVVVMPYYRCPEGGQREIGLYSEVSDGGPVAVSEVKVRYAYNLWEITYKTDMLKKSGLDLPSKSLYTDTYYFTIPFAVAKTIQPFGKPVYCYRDGREGQSTSRLSKLKHGKELLKIVLDLCKFCEAEKKKGNPNTGYMIRRIAMSYVYAVKTILLCPNNKEALEELKQFEGESRRTCEDVYMEAEKIGKIGLVLHLLRRTNYMVFSLVKIASDVLNREPQSLIRAKSGINP